MICENCGTQNGNEYRFCMKCGHELKTTNNNEEEKTIVEENLENESSNTGENNVIEDLTTPVEDNNTINNNPEPTFSNNQNNGFKSVGNNNFSYIKYGIDVIKKPFKTFKENEESLKDQKTSLIFSGVMAVLMMVVTLLKAMIMAIFKKSYDLSTLSYKTEIDFGGLNNLNYVDLIFKNLVIYAAIIALVALVYYIVSLVLKKNIDYFKMLAITSTSIIPFVIAGMILSPILGKIWSLLGIIATMVGIVYTILIFVNLVDEEIKFESIDKKIYFHLICLSIIGSAVYYLYLKIIFGSQTKAISDLLDLIK